MVKTVGLDPAVMASPVITTCVDALSMLVYFQVAKVILNL
ncbi:MAG: magnesium transporter [Christensenellaceae bacterium]